MNNVNPMQLLMNIIQSGGKINANQMMTRFGNNQQMTQAQNMMNSGNDPRQIINNIAKQKGIDQQQLNNLANQFGIKL